MHDQISVATVLGAATGLFAIALILLKFARSTKHGIAVGTILAIIFMTGSSFLWSMDSSGDYTRFRYGFPHFIAVKNYDFDYQNPMTPLQIHFDYALANLWFWFAFCMFGVGVFKVIVKRSTR